ncbi:MAG: magnesium transporter CorA family protein [Chloroflexi bacterium]|nr:magnesium transporter CorA family protein [Chloroflexota bacterium]
MAAAHTRAYRNGALESEDFPLSEVSDHLARPDTFVWIDFLDATRADLEELAEELDLHELAVDDALSPHQRPKLDRYESHLFLAAHWLAVDPATAALRVTEVDTFLNARWLVTVRKNAGFDIGSAVARWDRTPGLAQHGVSYLLYGLLDVIVDGYFDAVQVFDDYYDEVSEQIFEEHPLDPSEQRRWFQTRQALVRFHRLVTPLREAVSSLMRREHTAVAEDLYPYYQDVYDHILRVSEATDALRDLVGTIVETNISLRDYRQNQIVKQVTSWAAIIAVPTLITGYYGMNVPYPGFAEPWGAWAATVLTLGLSGALYLLFRRRDWL